VKTDEGGEMRQIESMRGQSERNQTLRGLFKSRESLGAFVKFSLGVVLPTLVWILGSG
jgi:hypothetical protein